MALLSPYRRDSASKCQDRRASPLILESDVDASTARRGRGRRRCRRRPYGFLSLPTYASLTVAYVVCYFSVQKSFDSFCEVAEAFQGIPFALLGKGRPIGLAMFSRIPTKIPSGGRLWCAKRTRAHAARSGQDIKDSNRSAVESQLASSVRSGRKRRTKSRRPVPIGRESDTTQTWRVFSVDVHPDLLGDGAVTPSERRRRGRGGSESGDAPSPPVEKAYLSQPVVDALASRLKTALVDAPSVRDGSGAMRTDRESDRGAVVVVDGAIVLPKELRDVRVVRRSLDARKKRRLGDGGAGPRYTYVLDVDVSASVAARVLRLKHQPGRLELLPSAHELDGATLAEREPVISKPKIIIVGAGPAGLFCALTLARSGLCVPTILERGRPVESRGKDIGALIHRRTIDSESNFAFGEGGAGTWSDGKLTTRIGRNSDGVRSVLETFVEYGAPDKILIDGAPHLGTDNLVRLLRNMRADLIKMGGDVRFESRVTKLIVEDGVAKGVEFECKREDDDDDGVRAMNTMMGDAVVLATGHSARDVYEELHASGVRLEPKGFASGFRVEHPQSLINQIQYGNEWGPCVVTGKGPTDAKNQEQFHDGSIRQHSGRLPVASYRLATDKAFDGDGYRGAYSFCMCPGGQIVPASTNPDEVCVNGMSFSKRDSLWANSALVVTISPHDPIMDPYRKDHGVLAGLAFQRDMERRASIMGGGNLTVPVQRLTDFMEGRPSTSAPSSSYRLGVKPAACHEIYPVQIVTALRDAVSNHFEKQMPGFLCDDALLHAVETRTSSPVRVSRDSSSLQAVGCANLFPVGEGAGFAGGIVSAAVDGMMVAEAVLDQVRGERVGSGVVGDRAKVKSVGFDY